MRLGQTSEVVDWEITQLGSYRLGNHTVGKLPLGKIPWEVATLEKAFGKVPNIMPVQPVFGPLGQV